VLGYGGYLLAKGTPAYIVPPVSNDSRAFYAWCAWWVFGGRASGSDEVGLPDVGVSAIIRRLW